MTFKEICKGGLQIAPVSFIVIIMVYRFVAPQCIKEMEKKVAADQ